MRRLLLFLSFAAVLAGCAGAAGTTLPQTSGLSNVGRVDAGLWRSAQPTREGFRSAERLGVKTVVNLRSMHSDADGLAGTSLEGVRVPCHQWSVSEDDLCAFLVVATDPERRPVLVHCAAGRDRTGACVAAYRIVEQGWSIEDALREMQSYGASPWFVNLPWLLHRIDPAALRARVAAARGAPFAPPAPIRRLRAACDLKTPSASLPASASSS